MTPGGFKDIASANTMEPKGSHGGKIINLVGLAIGIGIGKGVASEAYTVEAGDHSHPDPSPSRSPSGDYEDPNLFQQFAARKPTRSDEWDNWDCDGNDGEGGNHHEKETHDAVNEGVKDDHEPVKEELSPEGDAKVDDSWRRDKHGNVLQPLALYMRFYRRVRSISS